MDKMIYCRGILFGETIKRDNDFTPCPVAIGDELFPNGIFEFNITKMIEYIQEDPDAFLLKKWL